MLKRRVRRTSAVLSACLVMLVSALLGASVSSAAASAASLSLTRRAGPPTTELAIRASGFRPGETLDVAFDGSSVARVGADAGGRYAGSAGGVPASARPGTHTVRAVGLSSGAVGSAQFLVQTNWTQFKFDDAKTSVNPFENVLGVSNVGSLRLAWRGRAYFGPEPPTFKNRRLTGSPVVADGVVYVGSYDGHFYAFPTTCTSPCQPLWTADIANSIQGTAAVAGGVVYVGSSEGEYGNVGHVYAFPTSCTTPCQPLWRADTTGPVDTGIVVYQDRVYVSDDSGRLSVYPTSCSSPCQPLWYGEPTGPNEFDSSPTIGNGRVWVGSSSGHYRAWSLAECGQVSGLCPVDWSVKVESDPYDRYIDVTAAVTGGTLYFATFKPTVWAYPSGCSGPCGKRWSGTTGGGRIESSPAVYNGRVYMGAIDGNEWIFPTTCTPSCSPIGSYTLNGASSASPTIANGVLYQGSRSKRIYAFDASCLTACTPLWSYLTGDNVLSTAAVVDGRVYVGSNDGYLYAFAIP